MAAQHLAAQLDRLAERTGLGRKRGKQEIAQRVVVGKGETVLESAGQRTRRVGRHGHEALADVAGGHHAHLLADDARGAAVVGHGNDCRDEAAGCTQGANRIGLSRAAADGDGANLTRQWIGAHETTYALTCRGRSR